MRRKADIDFWTKNPQYFEVCKFLYKSDVSQELNLALNNCLVIYAENAKINHYVHCHEDDIEVIEDLCVPGTNEFMKFEPDGYALMIDSAGDLIEMFGEERARKVGLL